MKISIGINTYKPFDQLEVRQKLCIESLLKVQSMSDVEIELYSLQFEDEAFEIEGFNRLSVLKDKPYDLLTEYFDHHGLVEIYEERFKVDMPSIKGDKRPHMQELFNALSNTDCDYFIFLNDDIVLSDRFITQMKENPNYDSYPASRIHVYDMVDLSGTGMPESYSVHGFDGFGIRKEWWEKQKFNFPKELLGKPYWDVHYFTLCQLLGSAFTLNKLPPVMYHPHHDSTSCTTDDILSKYNTDVFQRDVICGQLWWRYVQGVLLKRPEVGGIKWWTPFPEEVRLERELFQSAVSHGITPNDQKDFSPVTLTDSKEFDAFLPCAPKDMIKLRFAVEGIIKNVKGLKDIHICTPKPIPKLDIDYPIYYHLDKEVMPTIDPLKWKFRPNWIFQQFLKLFQTVTSTEYYLIVDLDTVINRPMSMFEGDNPIWYTGWRQNHLPYFLFNLYMMNLEKTADHTFICDMNFFNRKIIDQMLDINNYTVDSFADKSYDLISNGCHIAEPEIYGSFVTKYYPELYNCKAAKQYIFGKDHSQDPNAVPWGHQEITELLKNKEDYDMVQMHSWCAGFEDHWK
jgi:hypothetical protein